jgi:histidinol phosphatase-like enzyme (inositol monophosphatase family)
MRAMSESARLHLELEGFALELGHMAGAIARAYFRSSFSIENKDARGFDPVTSADHAIESVLRKTIRERYPDHGIVAEEEGDYQSDARFTWFIDPIDGTKAFMMGSPLWGTLVGVTENRQPICGVLSQPVLEEVFFGSPLGSWLVSADGRRRLQSRGGKQLAEAILASTHPDMFSGESLVKFKALAERCLFHRYGGDCYNYALLAAGFIDLVVEAGLKPYDIVPLIPILEGAGCVVTNWEGEPALDGGRVVAAATPELHQSALEVLKSA